MFHKILIANRGEIAVRIIRACRELGITSVAVYSTADREALHTMLADEAICIDGPAPADSYLNMERILSAASVSKADAIHPGFGFLSENAKFAQMCKECNIAFIGPDAEVISKMGNKQEARNTMMAAKVPVVPGTKEAVLSAERGLELAKEIGFPVMIKAASGGGGKGMRISRSEADFVENFEVAQTESVNGFGDNTMYIEKYIERPRHIEFQILADKYGNVVSLGERDCSSRGAIRRWWRSLRPWRWMRNCAKRWARLPCGRRKRLITRAPEPSNSCWIKTKNTTLWR